jgi:hypothetical protein
MEKISDVGIRAACSEACVIKKGGSDSMILVSLDTTHLMCLLQKLPSFRQM